MIAGFTNSFSGLEVALIGIAVLVFFIVRQFSTRRIASWGSLLPPLALAYFGVQGLGQLDSTGWLVLGLSLSLGLGLGLARGMTFRVWQDAQGAGVMRGTGLTLVLWLATFAVKIGVSLIESRLGLGASLTSSAETLLPAAMTIAAQTLVVFLRSQDQRLVGYQMS